MRKGSPHFKDPARKSFTDVGRRDLIPMGTIPTGNGIYMGKTPTPGQPKRNSGSDTP